ncbi:hypothetical protein LTS18_012929 [Coniosporium uncinatum]|uniref:Uncharacterized protein n=1 Tax=Coniosporium uncinatum TaxID=93489 RepID=A0ACC3CXB6_9PEZI|nr:hypothetical protein LTS18_012929 [Coniosporium uncinatum]
MAPRTRNNPLLNQLISHLRLNLISSNFSFTSCSPSPSPSPLATTNAALHAKIRYHRYELHPYRPAGPSNNSTELPPHPAFPKTILQFWTLTEDQLDDLAAYYHQSEVGKYTNAYPVSIHWPTEWFADRRADERFREEEWMYRAVVEAKNKGVEEGKCEKAVPSQTTDEAGRPGSLKRKRCAEEEVDGADCLVLRKIERLAVKRRKFGKFIGLRGCETPALEAERYMLWCDLQVRRKVGWGGRDAFKGF